MAEADALFKRGKWSEATKAYDSFASSRGGGLEYWRAVLGAAKSREKSGDVKNSLAGADRVIKGALGRACDGVASEAFLLKQRLLFRAKVKSGVRGNLLKAATGRLGWTDVVLRLYENEAFRLLRDGEVEAASRIFFHRKLVPSPAGSNAVAVLTFARSKGSDGVLAARLVEPLSALASQNRRAAATLLEFARKSSVGEAWQELTCAAAEMAAAEGDWARARGLYEAVLSECQDRFTKQRLRLRFAEFLKSAGMGDRCVEIYGDWCRELKQGDEYRKGMRRYVGFLVESRRYRAAGEVLEKFCGNGKGVYSSAERQAILKKIANGIGSGEDDADVREGWKLLDRASALARAKKYGDAAKTYRVVATRYAGDLKNAALIQLGECFRATGKFQQAADTWDSLCADGGPGLRYECQKRKADMLFEDVHDVAAARMAYVDAASCLKDGYGGDDALRGIAMSVAMCDVAVGRIDDAEPVFKREYENAVRRRDVDLHKWKMLLGVCNSAKKHADMFRGTGVRDVVIADLLMASGRHEMANRMFLDCIRRRNLPRELLAYATMQRADCLSRQNKSNAALEVYESVRANYCDCRCAPMAMLMAGVLCVGDLGDDDKGSEFFKFVEEAWPKDPMAEQALFYRLTLAIWTKQWSLATSLRDEFVARYPKSAMRDIVVGEYGELIARRIPVLEKNFVQDQNRGKLVNGK